MHNLKRPDTNGRIAAIDILRGIAIAGMIMCANIGWDSNLPAWMYHAQTPPPTYAFNPDVPGLTWVDLVFPFFLFSMGAAFPFSLRKKIDKGQSVSGIILSLVKRWAILVIFSLVLGNGYRIGSGNGSQIVSNLFSIAVWLGMFMALTRFRFKKELFNHLANVSGVILMVILALLMQFTLGIELSKYSSNIIIMVLAYVALFGGIIWLISRNSITIRLCIFLAIGIIKGINAYCPEVFAFMPTTGSLGISWIFNWSFLQYLMIAIPGSIVGDLIISRKSENSSSAFHKWDTPLASLALLTTVFQLWGLFTRHVYTDLAVTALSGAIFIIMMRDKRRLWTDIIALGYILMVSGILFDPIDGGIKKDPCNISYMLTTSGMAAIVTGFLLMLEYRYGVKAKCLSECGQNPMIAYTVTNFITEPVLSLTGLLPLINSMTNGSQILGVARGLLIVGIMMAITIFFTRKKLFWRS